MIFFFYRVTVGKSSVSVTGIGSKLFYIPFEDLNTQASKRARRITRELLTDSPIRETYCVRTTGFMRRGQPFILMFGIYVNKLNPNGRISQNSQNKLYFCTVLSREEYHKRQR